MRRGVIDGRQAEDQEAEHPRHLVPIKRLKRCKPRSRAADVRMRLWRIHPDATMPALEADVHRAVHGVWPPAMRRATHAVSMFRVAVAGVFVCATAQAGAQAPMARGRTGLNLATLLAKWTGDLDGMQERRTIRVLTTYNRTLYFIDKGTERGTAADQGDCSKLS